MARQYQTGEMIVGEVMIVSRPEEADSDPPLVTLRTQDGSVRTFCWDDGCDPAQWPAVGSVIKATAGEPVSTRSSDTARQRHLDYQLAQDMSGLEIVAHAHDANGKPLPGRRVTDKYAAEDEIAGEVVWQCPLEQGLDGEMHAVFKLRMTDGSIETFALRPGADVPAPPNGTRIKAKVGELALFTRDVLPDLKLSKPFPVPSLYRVEIAPAPTPPGRPGFIRRAVRAMTGTAQPPAA